MKKTVSMLLIVVALICVVGWSGFAQKTRSNTIWEYKTLQGQDFTEKKLNELGFQGWELVSVAAYGNPSTGWAQTAYLKRAVFAGAPR